MREARYLDKRGEELLDNLVELRALLVLGGVPLIALHQGSDADE